MAKTIPMAVRADTKPMNDTIGNEKRLFIAENLVFDGINGKYEILADRRIKLGGESQVYMARRLSDKKEVVAKIYDEFQDTLANRENRQKAIEFLLSQAYADEGYYLPILDYGIISLPSKDGEDYRKPIDILPYCRLGEVKRADYDTLKTTIIPRIANALNLLHNSNIVHRDIKPANMYNYGGKVVLADFGIACEISNKTDFIGTTQGRGSLGYTAPEVSQSYAVAASDYFSFGCTIATLYKGEHIYQSYIDLNDRAAINRAINSHGLPLGCPDSERDLQSLVDALTIIDESKRAGYEDILLWLQNPAEFEQKFRNEQRSSLEVSFEFNFENVVYYNENDLINALAANWDVAKPYLYRGGIRGSTLVSFFTRINQTTAIRLGDVIEGRETATDFDLGLSRALHYIGNGGPLFWKGKSYRKLSDLSAAIARKQITNEELNEMLKSKYISWKLDNSTDVLPDAVSAVKIAESIVEKYPSLAYYYIMYQFAGTSSKQTYNGANTPDELFNVISKTPYSFYQYCTELLDGNDEIFAFLYFKGHLNNVMNLKESLIGRMAVDIELLYRLFEAICSNKEGIREHYYTYGPQSHLFWLQQNLDLYSFHTQKSREIRSNIQNINFSSTSTIDELSRNFLKLSEFQKDFLSVFQGNIHLAYLGINAGKEEITSSNTDAFYLETFCESIVPVGYYRFIQAGKPA